jgi:thymidylate synthase
MRLNKNINNILEFDFEDFTLENYQYYPAIKAPIAI